MEQVAGSIIEWASAGTALGEPGEGPESGDLHVVEPFPGGVLVALIDGLGHGAGAAAAARVAARVLEAHAGEPVTTLIERCHERLRKTRGAVMSLASLDARSSSMTALGVGNVDVVLWRADPGAARPREAIALRGGIVGYRLPLLRVTALPLSRDDTVVMATDGIRSGFATRLELARHPRDIAASILARFGSGSDDALVVVLRYLGVTA